MADTLQKFMFENSAVRGELVELSETWRQVLARRRYPQPIRTLLGEMLSAAALLSANLKFDGSLIMQMHGDGPVSLLVVECDSMLKMRATAKFAPGAEIPDDAGLRALVNQHGNGRFAITLDPREKLPGQQPYQGIVSLDGDSVATVIENYMLRSEQLDTRLWLAADDQFSRGLLLQKIPGEGGIGSGGTEGSSDPRGGTEPGGDADAEDWNRAVMLASTLRTDEMLQADISTLMHRLFWEETIRVFEPRHPVFHCSCSRERVGNMLKMLGRQEIDSALEELGSLSIDCDFCGQHYHFDAVDCAQLFATDLMVDALRKPGDLKQ